MGKKLLFYVIVIDILCCTDIRNSADNFTELLVIISVNNAARFYSFDRSLYTLAYHIAERILAAGPGEVA